MASARNVWFGAYAPVQGAVSRTLGDGRTTYANKGVQRMRKAARREQAEARNAKTLPGNRRKVARVQGFTRHSERIRAGM